MHVSHITPLSLVHTFPLQLQSALSVLTEPEKPTNSLAHHKGNVFCCCVCVCGCICLSVDLFSFEVDVPCVCVCVHACVSGGWRGVKSVNRVLNSVVLKLSVLEILTSQCAFVHVCEAQGWVDVLYKCISVGKESILPLFCWPCGRERQVKCKTPRVAVRK